MPKKEKVKYEKISEALKGNRNALGNNGGRPAMYDDPEELAEKVEEYFVWCEGEKEEREGVRTHINKDGSKTTETYTYDYWIREPESPSITGIAIHLGFESRQSMYDYVKKPKFSYSIKRALLKVENTYEKGLWTNSPSGVIFALKNMNWTDRMSIDQTIDEKMPKTKEEKLARIQELKEKLIKDND